MEGFVFFFAAEKKFKYYHFSLYVPLCPLSSSVRNRILGRRLTTCGGRRFDSVRREASSPAPRQLFAAAWRESPVGPTVTFRRGVPLDVQQSFPFWNQFEFNFKFHLMKKIFSLSKILEKKIVIIISFFSFFFERDEMIIFVCCRPIFVSIGFDSSEFGLILQLQRR